MSTGGGHNRILAGLGLGALCGVVANTLVADSAGARRTLDMAIDTVAHPIGQIFLRLLFVVVLPLVFASISVGVASLGDIRKLGSLGARTLGFFVVTSAASAVLGIAALHLLQPGAGFDSATVAELQAKYAGDVKSLADKAAAGAPLDLLGRVNQILDMFLPRNMLRAAVDMQMIPLIVFALLLGAALTFIEARKRELLTSVLEGVSDAMVTVVGFAMRLAPYAVFCLIFGVTARFGLGLLQKLGLYVGIILVCYLIQLLVLYPLLLALLARRNPWQFLKSAMPVMVTAFSTSSSNATLPTSIRVAQESLGIRPQIAGFVLPLGATLNMNGTALFEGVVVLFLAQVSGLELTLSTQVLVVVLSVLTAIGAAGVPGGSLPLIVTVMQQVEIPPEMLALVLGVDRLVDMARTVPNVTGDLVGALVVARSEGRLPP